jgi:hypothetical protein
MMDVLMTYEEVLKYLRTTKYTLDNLIIKHGMPYSLKDGEYFFFEKRYRQLER